jgi:hypothetical protein
MAYLQRVGEVIKKIERDAQAQSELEKFGPFPWNAYKRIRDHIAHPARYRILNPESSIDPAFVKEFMKVAAASGEARAQGRTFPTNSNPLLHELGDAMHQLRGIQLLLDEGLASNNKTVELIGTTPASEAAKLLHVDKKHLPHAIAHITQRQVTLALTDVLSQLSRVSRSNRDSIATPEWLDDLYYVRDCLAHHNHELLGKHPAEALADIYPRIVLMQGIIRAQVPELANKEAKEKWVEEKAHNYTCRAQYKFSDDQHKCEMLDSFTTFITSTPKTTFQQQEAYINEFGQVLRTALTDDCKMILDYLNAHKKDLRDPQRMLKSTNEAPAELQLRLKAFFESVVRMTKPMGIDMHAQGAVTTPHPRVTNAMLAQQAKIHGPSQFHK